jgi:hypothetical protein
LLSIWNSFNAVRERNGERAKLALSCLEKVGQSYVAGLGGEGDTVPKDQGFNDLHRFCGVLCVYVFKLTRFSQISVGLTEVCE